MLDPKAKAAAISRILDSKPPSSALKEAFRLKCNVRTIEKLVAEERVKRGMTGAAPPPGGRPVDGPPDPAGSPGGGGEKSPIDKVKEAAGGGAASPPASPGKAAPPPPPDPKAEGQKIDADYAIKELGRLKAVAVACAGVAVGIPIDDPVLEEESEISGLVKTAIKESGEEIADHLRKVTGGGPYFLLALLAIDAIASGVALWRRSSEIKPAGKTTPGRAPIKKAIDGQAEVKK